MNTGFLGIALNTHIYTTGRLECHTHFLWDELILKAMFNPYAADGKFCQYKMM